MDVPAVDGGMEKFARLDLLDVVVPRPPILSLDWTDRIDLAPNELAVDHRRSAVACAMDAADAGSSVLSMRVTEEA